MTLSEKLKRLQEWNRERVERSRVSSIQREEKRAEYLKAHKLRLKEEAEASRYEAQKRRHEQRYRPKQQPMRDPFGGGVNRDPFPPGTFSGGGSLFGSPTVHKKHKKRGGKRIIIQM